MITEHDASDYNILRQHPKEPGSLFMLMNQADHAPRRIIWDRAFSTASLKTYLPTMHSRVHELTSQLTAVSRGGQVVDIAAWLNYFAVDFMGDFVWGGEFAFMAGKGHDPENGDFMKVLQEGNVALELLVPVPWARVIAQALPDKGFAMLKAHAKKIMLRRRTEGAKGGSRDLMYFLLNEDGQGTHAPFDDDTLEYEAVLAMVAGSDTTSTAMANSVFYLMENPKYYARLRAELDEAAEKSEITSVEDHLDVHVLATLPFLNAVMQAFTHLLPDLY
jgi:cytochrome P450